MRSIVHRDEPPRKGYVRGELESSGFVIKAVPGDPKNSNVTYLVQINPKGHIPARSKSILSPADASKSKMHFQYPGHCSSASELLSRAWAKFSESKKCWKPRHQSIHKLHNMFLQLLNRVMEISQVKSSLSPHGKEDPSLKDRHCHLDLSLERFASVNQYEKDLATHVLLLYIRDYINRNVGEQLEMPGRESRRQCRWFPERDAVQKWAQILPEQPPTTVEPWASGKVPITVNAGKPQTNLL